MASVISARHRDRSATRRQLDRVRVGDAEPGRVVGMDLQGAARLAPYEDVEVVHPRVVRAEVAPTDEHEFVDSAARRAAARRGGPGRRAAPPAPARSRPDGVRNTSGSRGSSGPRSTPCGASTRSSSDSPYGPVRSRRSSSRSGPRRPSAADELVHRLEVVVVERRQGIASRRAGPHARAVWSSSSAGSASAPAPCASMAELGEDLPFVGFTVLDREHRLGVVGDVAHRELQQGQVVVAALEARWRGQDHIGVPGRLVQVDVDRHHEVEGRRARRRADRRGSASTAPGCRQW